MKNELKPADGSLHLDKNYKHFLSGIKERLQSVERLTIEQHQRA